MIHAFAGRLAKKKRSPNGERFFVAQAGYALSFAFFFLPKWMPSPVPTPMTATDGMIVASRIVVNLLSLGGATDVRVVAPISSILPVARL